MSIFQSVVLGIIQGVTEFLPISSSGHLIIVPWFLGWQEHALSFDVMLHAGSLLALLIYFRSDWQRLLKIGLLQLPKRGQRVSIERKMLLYIVIATIPAALLGAVFKDKFEATFRSVISVAAAIGIFSIVIYIAEILGNHKRYIKDLSLKDSVLIGLCQALAFIPGISRSAATMSAGLFLNLKREEAARFSFLLSAPIILSASLVELKDIFHQDLSMPRIVLLGGFLASFISGIISIHFLLGFLKRHNFKVFVIYRLILAGLIIGLFLMRKSA